MRLAVLTLVLAALPASADDNGCTFARGTTTCITDATRSETVTVQMISGCLYGSDAVAGRRTRTFDYTYLVTDETTTLAHGMEGPVYSSQTAEISRTLESSVQISDVCA